MTDPPPCTSSPWSHPHRRPALDHPAQSLNILGITGLAELVGLGDVHDHPCPGSLQLGHLRTLDRLAMSSTSPTTCPTTGTRRRCRRRSRRMRRLHERIPSPTRKNNATNDFQHEIGISNSLSYSGTHATNIGKSGRLSGGPETYVP